MEIKPSPKSAKPSETSLAELTGFIQDDRHHFVTVAGTQFRVDRATPLGVALTGLQSAGNSEYWQKALERGARDSVRIPNEADEISEAPPKPSIWARLFGQPPKPPPKPAAVTKLFIPKIPNYAGAAEALGIEATAIVAKVRVHETGVNVTMSDGKEIEAEPKGALARSVAVLLEELDAIGEAHLEARAVVNAPLKRPVFEMPRFGRGAKVQRKAKQGGAAVPQQVNFGGNSSVDTFEPKVPNVAGSGSFKKQPPADLEDAPPLSEPDSMTAEAIAPPLEQTPPYDPAEEARNLPSNEGTFEEFLPPAPVQPKSSPAPSPAPTVPTAVNPKVSPTAAFVDVPPVREVAPQGVKVSAPPAEDMPPDSVSDETQTLPANEGEVESALSEEQLVKENPATAPQKAPIETSDAAPGPTPLAGAGARTDPNEADWSSGFVRIGQRTKPKPGGPFTVEARSREIVSGKYQARGQFKLSKADYEVVQWLSKTRREALFSVALVDPTAETADHEIPEARIESVSIKNETVFVPVNWKHCREEFERANTVQSSERRDAIKSAVVETAVATPLIPTTVKAAPAKPEDFKPGVLALPKLRPLKVPVAALNIGPSFGR